MCIFTVYSNKNNNGLQATNTFIYLKVLYLTVIGQSGKRLLEWWYWCVFQWKKMTCTKRFFYLFSQKKKKGSERTVKSQLKIQHMHHLCEALSCDSPMTNPQAEFGLLLSLCRVDVGGVWDPYPCLRHRFLHIQCFGNITEDCAIDCNKGTKNVLFPCKSNI